MTDSFVHLHNHSTYSLLDGASKVDELVSTAIQDGQSAIGITDHGVCYGLLQFYKECNEQGIKPILGIEAYMARNSVDERPKPKTKVDDGGGETEKGEKLFHHLTVLAESTAGYHNILKLSSEAFMRGFYRKPRVDWDILERHAEGLIVTTGCLGGVVLQELLHERTDEALAAAGRLQDIFGKDSLFVELQDHGIPEQIRTNPQLIEIAKKIGAPLLATNDSHYPAASDARGHDALLCLQTGAKVSDTDRFKFHGEGHYLKTAAEMRHLFEELPEACDNTLLIAERCSVDIPLGQNLVPKFDIPDGFIDEPDYLRHLVAEGALERWTLTEEVTDRLEYELEVIINAGFAGYFLIVWDLVQHAKSVGIRVGPGRGSAAGCAVAYSLGITEIDPLKWGLLFERFLNPERVSNPDIDLDFDSRYRDHMINYTTQKYGDDRVAQIVTFGRIRSRNAVRDAGRVLGHPFLSGDKLAKALPPLLYGHDTPLAACLEYDERHKDGFERAASFREMYRLDPINREIVDVALNLEGLTRSDGVHAAAVVIAPDALTNYVPLQKKPKGPLVTQYEMDDIEDIGLLKMDYLGLRNLNVISDTLRIVKARKRIDIDLDSLDLADPKSFETLQAGETIGVFQLEGSNMRQLLRSLKPEEFDHVAAALALYRPGPMAADMHNAYADRKNGRQPIEVFHPDATDILSETYGLMVYQEELMEVAQRFAGYQLGEAYALLKTCAKKLPEAMEKEREKFVAGVTERYDKDLGEELFATVSEFANYAFNKSHSYAYALISFQTVFLKTHYPIEYMTALLTSVQSDHTKLGLYLSEAKRMDIEVKPPDINVSQRTFHPDDDDRIVFGLLAIKDIGEQVAQAIVEERAADGPYADYFDYAERSTTRCINKKVTTSLISGGAFDLMHPRKGLLEISVEVAKAAVAQKKVDATGAQRLFDEPPAVKHKGVPNLHFDEETRLAMEREFLGVFVSGHPLSEFQSVLDDHIDYSMDEVLEMEPQGWGFMKLGGMVTDVKEIITKRRGEKMKTFELEDITGRVPCIIFPKQHVTWGNLIENDAIILVDVKVEEDRMGLKAVVRNVEGLKRRYLKAINAHIVLPDTYSDTDLARAIRQCPGAETVTLVYRGQRRYPDDKVDVETLKALLLQPDWIENL